MGLLNKIGSHINPYFLIFLLSIFLNYLPDILPYYSALLSNNKLKVVGKITQFEEKCDSEDVAGWSCRTQYRIPKKIYQDYESIGFGIIVFPIEVSCPETNEKITKLSTKSEDGKLSTYLRTYQVLEINKTQCKTDLIVKNWSKKNFYRYGLSQSSVITGDTFWVNHAKKTIELSIILTLLITSLTYLIFYYVLKTLENVTNIKYKLTVFDSFAVFMLLHILLTSGLVFEVILPFTFPLELTQKVTNYFGLLGIAGPITYFLYTKTDALINVQKNEDAITSKSIILILSLIFLLLLIPTNFRITYPILVIGLSFLAITPAIITKELIILLFLTLALSDGLKIMMIPHLPGSRCSTTYALLAMVYAMKKQIEILEKNSKINAGLEIALKISHDIRSPLGALKNIIPYLNGDEKIKNIGTEAINKITNIAESFLIKYKMEDNAIEKLTHQNIVHCLRNTVESKLFEIRDEYRDHVKVKFESKYESLICVVDPLIFQTTISNIINNSLEALKNINDGIIDITVKKIDKTIAISVTDNGPGIPESVLQYIGSKGISTKKNYQTSGTGSGLYYAKKSVNEWEGRLIIKNTTHKSGTKVTIILPLYK